jgi:hypothetical protein
VLRKRAETEEQHKKGKVEFKCHGCECSAKYTKKKVHILLVLPVKNTNNTYRKH